MNWLITKRHLYMRFAENLVVFLCSTWSLKRFRESKLSTECCPCRGGYCGANTDLRSVHEEAGTDWNWDSTSFHIGIFFYKILANGYKFYLKFCCYIEIFMHTHYLSLSQYLSYVSCCVEINYSICGFPSVLICQHFSNLDEVSHLHLTPWHRLPDQTSIPTETEQTRPTGSSHNIDSTLLFRTHSEKADTRVKISWNLWLELQSS